MHKFAIKVDGLQYEGVFQSSVDAVRDALAKFQGARSVVARAICPADLYPDPCPDTGRRVVTVAEWHERPDDLIDEFAYWYNPDARQIGLDPWKLIEGVDRRLVGGGYDVDFANGTYRTVEGERKIYVKASHFARLNLGRP